MDRTKCVTKTALAAAIAFVVLSASALAPSAALSLAAIAGLIPVVLVAECGYGKAFAAYFVSGLLGIVLLPDKSGAALFVLLFGYYSILKQWLEQRLSVVVAWICKLFFANIIFFVFFFCFTEIFLAVVPSIFTVFWITWLVYLVAFFVYDRASAAWLLFYTRRIQR